MNDDGDERSFFDNLPGAPSKARAKAKAPAPPAPEKPVEKPHYLGHRDRVRERFRIVGTNGLPDYELLEMLLYRTRIRGDTKPTAKALIAKFGSFAEVLGAPENLLQEVPGIGPEASIDIKIVAAAAHRMARGLINQRHIMSSWEKVLEYCRAAMAFEQKEQFRILFLDKKNGLIADEVQQVGTIDHAPVYPREVIKRALELSASAIIMVHNHPSGDPTPSHADIEVTRNVIASAKPMGIVVQDHLIIGKSGFSSMKGLLLI